jgi:hypothetical protein
VKQAIKAAEAAALVPAATLQVPEHVPEMQLAG